MLGFEQLIKASIHFDGEFVVVINLDRMFNVECLMVNDRALPGIVDW